MRLANPDWNVDILGVNASDQLPYNSLIISENTLAWLQDTPQDHVWDLWGVNFRDVRILDPQNRLIATYNLTDHDLAVSTNRAALKTLFLEAAQAIDSDHDGLPDDWEILYFGNLSSGPNDDPDHDGFSNFDEFAFGTNPINAGSHAPIFCQLSWPQRHPEFSVLFRRPAGGMINFTVEASTDLATWSSFGTQLAPAGTPRVLFDRTGTAEAKYLLDAPYGDSSPRFIRVRAVPRGTQ